MQKMRIFNLARAAAVGRSLAQIKHTYVVHTNSDHLPLITDKTCITINLNKESKKTHKNNLNLFVNTAKHKDDECVRVCASSRFVSSLHYI